MRLFLCRHADAVNGDGDEIDDSRRWLSSKGRAQSTAVGKALAGHGERADFVLASSLVRAVQTAEALARETGFPSEIRILRAIEPEGTLSDLLEAIDELPPQASVFVVGHEPQMGEWATALLGRGFPRPFAKAAVLGLEFDGAAALGAGKVRFWLTAERLAFETVG